MRIIVTEVEMNKWKTVYQINLNSESGVVWEEGVDEYEITDYIIETIQDLGVFGWVDGVNRFGKPVKRTYMLVPE